MGGIRLEEERYLFGWWIEEWRIWRTRYATHTRISLPFSHTRTRNLPSPNSTHLLLPSFLVLNSLYRIEAFSVISLTSSHK